MLSILKSSLSFVSSGYTKVLTGLGMALTALLALFAYGYAKKKEGASEAATEALRGDVSKLEKAREAAYREKRNVDGISDSDLVDRLRRRGDDWGSL